MSTHLETPDVTEPITDVDMVTTLEVGPGGLDRYLDLVGDRRNPLIKYHGGSLTLVSPSHKHERGAETPSLNLGGGGPNGQRPSQPFQDVVDALAAEMDVGGNEAVGVVFP